jgi:HSP20 family molecular chaperone IbpA
MEKKMKETMSRVSIPGRILDLLWSDDEFFRDISSHKKTSSAGKFPRCDQWCDEKGFHMAFALAGYSPGDVEVSTKDNELHIVGRGSKVDSTTETSSKAEVVEDEYPAKAPNIGVQHGIIVRGIARRNFKTKYFINPAFNLDEVSASMRNGLLEILIPKKDDGLTQSVIIEEK